VYRICCLIRYFTPAPIKVCPRFLVRPRSDLLLERVRHGPRGENGLQNQSQWVVAWRCRLQYQPCTGQDLALLTIESAVQWTRSVVSPKDKLFEEMSPDQRVSTASHAEQVASDLRCARLLVSSRRLGQTPARRCPTR
jgi:hypothetical protein